MSSRYNLRSRDANEDTPVSAEKKKKRSLEEEVVDDEEEISASKEDSSSVQSARPRRAKEQGQKRPRYVLVDSDQENQDRSEEDDSEATASLEGFIVPDKSHSTRRIKSYHSNTAEKAQDEESEDDSYEHPTDEANEQTNDEEVEDSDPLSTFLTNEIVEKLGNTVDPSLLGEAVQCAIQRAVVKGKELQEEKDEYFAHDTNPLADFLTAKLTKKLGNDIPPEQLRQAVQNAIRRAEADLVDEYCGAVPKDEKWKVGLDDATIERLEPILMRIRQSHKITVPTIADILDAPILMSQKAEAIALYDMIQNMEPYTPKRYYTEKKLLRLIGRFENEWTIDVPEAEQEIELAHAEKVALEMRQKAPTLSRILTAKIPLEQKRKAVELYNILPEIHPLEALEKQYFLERLIEAGTSYTYDQVDRLEETEKKYKEKMTRIPSSTVEIKNRIFNLNAPEDLKAVLYEKYQQMMSMSPSDSDYDEFKKKILMILDLPHLNMVKSPVTSASTPEEINAYCSSIYEKIDSKLYGMKKVKQELMQILVNRITNPTAQGVNLALLGSPGTGKTAICRALADALEVPFDVLSMGGMDDTSLLKGMSSVWQGAEQSIVLQILAKMKVSNGIILVDEIDKLGETHHGRHVQYALLNITDYTQNQEFRDNYLRDFHVDLSKVWFVFTMNDKSKLDPAMRDRLYIIDVPTYSKKEQAVIISKYVVPRALANVGMTKEDVTITEEGALSLLELMKDEVEKAGVRPVEKEIKSIVSKINLLRTITLPDGTTGKVEVTYKVPNFKMPFTLDAENVRRLFSREKEKEEEGISMMYI